MRLSSATGPGISGRSAAPSAWQQKQQTCRLRLEALKSQPDGDSVAGRMPFNYVSSDGKQKATLEDAFVESRGSSGAGQIEHNASMGRQQPWNLGWQMSERNLIWNDDLAARLLKRVTAEELSCSDEELEARFLELLAVMPGLRKRMQTMKPKLLAKLTDDPAAIAAKLLELKAVFPTANVEQMVLRDLRLLLDMSVGEVQAAADELRSILPDDVDIDRLCEEHPSMLEVESFREALNEVKRLMPKLNISTALNTDPGVIFSTQRTKSMIPYDPVPGNPH